MPRAFAVELNLPCVRRPACTCLGQSVGQLLRQVGAARQIDRLGHDTPDRLPDAVLRPERLPDFIQHEHQSPVEGKERPLPAQCVACDLEDTPSCRPTTRLLCQCQGLVPDSLLTFKPRRSDASRTARAMPRAFAVVTQPAMGAGLRGVLPASPVDPLRQVGAARRIRSSRTRRPRPSPGRCTSARSLARFRRARASAAEEGIERPLPAQCVACDLEDADRLCHRTAAATTHQSPAAKRACQTRPCSSVVDGYSTNNHPV